MPMINRPRLTYLLSVLILPCVALAWSQQVAQQPPQKVKRPPLPAPTFYLAIKVRGCASDEITARGVSNLPPGAIIGFMIADSYGDIGWKNCSDEVIATVGEDGHFEATIHPKGDLTFRPNLLITAFFGTVYHHQPQNVLNVVGRHGENLDDLDNPQASTVSGFNTILSTMARVPACGPPHTN